MNEEVGTKYSKAYCMINDMVVRKLSLQDRKDLQGILSELLNENCIKGNDRENFLYWYSRYEEDMQNLRADIESRIQRERAVIELSQQKIEELKSKLILSH